MRASFDGTSKIFLLLLSVILLNGVDASSPYVKEFPSFDVKNLLDSTLYVPSNADSSIAQGALQLTPDSSNNRTEFSKRNRSGRILLNRSFKGVQSFNASFVINITPLDDDGGEGVAFLICKSLEDTPKNSYGRYLGLFNATTDGKPSNGVIGVEFDTSKSGPFDPDDNHVGVDVHSIDSVKVFSLKSKNITIKSGRDLFALVQYDGRTRNFRVFVDSGSVSRSDVPVISMVLDLSKNVSRNVYFGFSGSTGAEIELNCIRSWNLTVVSAVSNDLKGLVIALSVGLSLAVVVGVVGSVWGFLRWRRKQRLRRSIRGLDRVLTDSAAGPRKFRFKELRMATHNFDKKHLLGQGGFGAVYKGALVNKTLVAVKRVSENSNQGEQEFISEVMIISRLRHKNLVRLLGWCYEDAELLLVYDYMRNGSLDRLIFSHDDKTEILDWNRRYKIICGVASALLYLHEECEQQVLHRDLKASNVMLDSEYNARLGDFGLAKLIEHDKNSYTTTAIAGTPGYIAPECFHTGRATVQSDIFSFGALALEVACGRRPRMPSMVYLVDWVWGLYGDNRILDAADPKLGDFDKEEMRCILLLGLACSHPLPQERPTMRMVQQILAKDTSPPGLPLTKPAFVWPTPGFNMAEIPSGSSDFSTQPTESIS